MNRISHFVLPIVASALFAGCSSTPVTTPTAATPAAVSVAPAPAAPPLAAVAGPVAPAPAVAAALEPYLDPKSPIFQDRSVYFDFDDFSIKNTYADLIERHGKYLASKPSLPIKIEGNSDERGGSEYNLALGQKRAEAVLKALKIYGVKDSQMEATSWGSERPKAAGHDETAWAQNRRVDLVYPAK